MTKKRCKIKIKCQINYHIVLDVINNNFSLYHKDKCIFDDKITYKTPNHYSTEPT